MDKIRLFLVGVLRRFAWAPKGEPIGERKPSVKHYLGRTTTCGRREHQSSDDRGSQFVKTYSLSKRRRSVFLACGEILGLLTVA